MAILCACMPNLRLLLVHFFPKFFDSTPRPEQPADADAGGDGRQGLGGAVRRGSSFPRKLGTAAAAYAEYIVAPMSKMLPNSLASTVRTTENTIDNSRDGGGEGGSGGDGGGDRGVRGGGRNSGVPDESGSKGGSGAADDADGGIVISREFQVELRSWSAVGDARRNELNKTKDGRPGHGGDATSGSGPGAADAV